MLTRARAAVSFIDLTDSGIQEVGSKRRKRRKKADGGNSNVEEDEESRNRRSQPVRIMTRNRRRSPLPVNNSVDSDVITVDDSSQESSSSCISSLSNSRTIAPPGRAKRQSSSGLDFQNSFQKRRKSTSASSDSSAEIQILLHKRVMPSPMNLDCGIVSTDVETMGSFESDESVIIGDGQSDDMNVDSVIQDAKSSQGRVKVEVSDETTVLFEKFRVQKVLLRSQDSGLKCAKPLKLAGGDDVSGTGEVHATDSEPDVVTQRDIVLDLVPQRDMQDVVPDSNILDEELREAQQDLMIDSAANSQPIAKESTPEMVISIDSSEDSKFDSLTSFEDMSGKSCNELEQESSSPKLYIADDSVTLSLPVTGDCMEHPKYQIDGRPSAESKVNVVTIADHATIEDNKTVCKVTVNESKEGSNESENTHAQQMSVNGCHQNEESNAENHSLAESNENITGDTEQLPSETSELLANETTAVENPVSVVTHQLTDERPDSKFEVAKTPAGTSTQSVCFPKTRIIKCEPWTSAVYDDISDFEFSNGVQNERKIECIDLDDSSESTNVHNSHLESPSSSSKTLQVDSECFYSNESSMVPRHSQDLEVPVPITETIINSCQGTSSDPHTFQETKNAADESRNEDSSVTAVIVTHQMHPFPRQRRIYDRSVHKEFQCSRCNRQYRLLHAFKAHLLKCCPHNLPLDLPLTRVELRTKKFMFSQENITKAVAEYESKRPVDSYRNPPSNDGGSAKKKRRGRPCSEETSQSDQQPDSIENTQDLGLASSTQGTQNGCGGKSSSSEDISIISVPSTVHMPEAQQVPLAASEVEVAIIEDTKPSSQNLNPNCITEFHDSRNIPAATNIEIPSASQLHEMFMSFHTDFDPVTFDAIYPDETPEENLSYVLLSLEVAKPGGMYYNRRAQMAAQIMEKAASKASELRTGKELKRVGQICKTSIRVIRPNMQHFLQPNLQKFSQPTSSSSQANSLNLLLD